MSIGLSTKELADIRTSIGELLPDTCYIIDVTNTENGLGGYTEGTAMATGGTISCRLDARIINTLRSSEKVVGGAIQPFHQFILTIPHDTTISTLNRVQKDSDVYNVVSVDDDKSWRGSVRVILERI